MVDTETLTARTLRPGDLPALMALVEEAGWNQTEGDWTRMLALGHGEGFTDGRGQVVASAMAMPYAGRIGWIGMVLVNGSWRRRGLATRLIGNCTARMKASGLIPALDATPAGEAVYGRMGFEGATTITRWRGSGRGSGEAASGARLIDIGDLDWIADLDARAFGADRRELLSALLVDGAALGQNAFLIHRTGRSARQIGPICAVDAPAAQALLADTIAHLDGPLLIDVPDHQHDLADLLTDAGFKPERPFRRMYLGAPGPIGAPTLLHAIAGPELG